jgi:hypothetical protein
MTRCTRHTTNNSKTDRVVARGRCQSKGKRLLSPGLISPIERAEGVCKDLDGEYLPESPHIPDMRRGSGTACVYLAAGLLRDVGQLGDSFASLFAHLKRFAG